MGNGRFPDREIRRLGDRNSSAALYLCSVENVNWTQIDRAENNYLLEDKLMSHILSLQEPGFEVYLMQPAVLTASVLRCVRPPFV